MTQNLDAIYKSGSFCPVNEAAVTLSDGARVRLTVEPIPQYPEKNVLDLAAKVYAGLSDEDITDIEKIAMDRTNFFSPQHESNSMDKAVLDTDTLSAIMRQHSTTALSCSQVYLSSYSQLTISIVTRFEILRGLSAKKATSQTSAFHAMCQSLEVLPLTDAVIVRAADIYGRLHQTGQLIGYPFDPIKLPLKALQESQRIEIISMDSFYLGQLIGDLCYSINHMEGGPLQDQLFELCDRLEAAEKYGEGMLDVF